MRAEIVTVGDELCRGEIIDTNAAWLAAELWDLDVTCAFLTSCRDVPEEMRACLAAAAARTDLVLVSGGLGPTEDDLTVDVVSALAGVEPVIHEGSLERMRARFEERGLPMSKNHTRQVRVPAGARVYENSAGAAPGFEVAVGGTPLICMPGFPREVHAIFEGGVRGRVGAIRDRAGVAVERIARRIYRVYGKGESHIAGSLEGITSGVAGASLHFQVKFPEILVKVVVRDTDAGAASERLAALDGQIRARLGRSLYGTDDDTLPAAVGRALAARGLSVATAESCTGGLIGSLITSVPGASAYYRGGAITYSNEEKIRQLGVNEGTLRERGAVSSEVVEEMARGALARLGADIAVSVSGVAGPDGGTPEKPVGTVWLAVAGPGDALWTRKLLWPGSREQVRLVAAYSALAGVLRAASGDERRPGVTDG